MILRSISLRAVIDHAQITQMIHLSVLQLSIVVMVVAELIVRKCFERVVNMTVKYYELYICFKPIFS